MSEKSQKVSTGCGYLLALILFGLFGFIALPSFLNSAIKSKQSEAKSYVGMMNRAQQAFVLERNAFSENIDKLGLGISSETKNYSYSIRTNRLAVFNYATPRTEKIRGYVGGVFLGIVQGKREIEAFGILCEANSPSSTRLPDPLMQDGVLKCPPGTNNLSERYTENFSKAKDIVFSKDWNLAHSSAKYAAANQYNQAFNLAAAIQDDVAKERILAVIAYQLASHYNQGINQALKIAQTIKNNSHKENALEAIKESKVITPTPKVEPVIPTPEIEPMISTPTVEQPCHRNQLNSSSPKPKTSSSNSPAIPFHRSSLDSYASSPKNYSPTDFPIKGTFEGEYRIHPDSVEVFIKKGTISNQYGIASDSYGRTIPSQNFYFCALEVALDYGSTPKRWERLPRQRSAILNTVYLKPGESYTVTNLRFVIPKTRSTELSKMFISFGMETEDGGYCYTHLHPKWQ